MDDPFRLQRFVEAQAPVYTQVCNELHNGQKRSHWMWFIFPQITGLGASAMSQHYAISGRAETEAFLQHAILGPRLAQCVGIINAVTGKSAHAIFGSPDDMKLQSCLTLFGAVAPAPSVYTDALAKYFDGQTDPATLPRL